MATFKIGGIPIGDAYNLSVTSGSNTQNVNGAAYGQTQSATLTVRRSPISVAPHIVTFQANVTNFGSTQPGDANVFDETQHDLQYEWDFGDPGSQHLSSNLTTRQRNANIAYGKQVSHYYASPGTYTVTCTITEPGTNNNTQVTEEVVIAATTTAFASGDINYIDPDSDYTDAPAGARTFNSLDTFLAAHIAGTYDANPQLVYLARGKTFASTTNHIYGSGQRSSLFIMTDPDNAGDRATITHDDGTRSGSFILINGGDTAGTTQLSLHDLNAVGPADVTTGKQSPSGLVSSTFITMSTSQDTFGDHFTMTECDFSGFENVVIARTNKVRIANCNISDWHDYGIQASVNLDFVLLGNIFEQNPDSLSGGPKWDETDQLVDTTFPNHGPVRMYLSDWFIALGNDMFSNNGWFPNTPGYATQQPCMRLFVNGDEFQNVGAKCNIQDNIFEGGFDLLAFDETNGGAGTSLSGTVERNTFVATYGTQRVIGMRHGGVAVRSNVFHRPNTESLNSTLQMRSLIEYLDPQNTTTEAAPHIFSGNTLMNLCTDANDESGNASVSATRDSSFFDSVTVEDNYLHQPGMATPSPALYTNIDTTTKYTARTKGYTSYYRRYETTIGSVANGGTFNIAYDDVETGLVLADINTNNTANYDHILQLGVVGSGAVADVSWSFGATEVTITNNTGGAISGTITVHLVCLSTTLETRFASPANTVQSGAPLAGSTNDGVSSSLEGWDDFNGVTRGATHSKGAIEIA